MKPAHAPWWLRPFGGSHTFEYGPPYDLIYEEPMRHSFTLSTPADAYQISYAVYSNVCNNREWVGLRGSATGREPVSGTANLSFPVGLGRVTQRDVTLRYATSDGTALAGSDYTATSGSVFFPAGRRETKWVTVPIRADSAAEGSETFRLTIATNTAEALPASSVVTGTILNTAASSPPPPPPPAVPTTPVGLYLLSRTSTSLSFGWAGVAGATGYRIYRDAAAVSTTTSTAATLSGLASNRTYGLSVSAYNASGESARSQTLSAQTLATYRYAVIAQDVVDPSGAAMNLGHLRPGQRGTIKFSVQNTGSATWSNSGTNPVRLATDVPRDRTNSPIATSGWVSLNRPAQLREATVAPGGTGTFQVPFVVPDRAATITENYTLVAENLAWMDGPGAWIQMTIHPIVGIAPAATGHWLVADDGGVFTYDGAPFYGSAGASTLNKPMVGMSATPNRGGYWLVAADGGVFAYGNATYHGSRGGQPLNAPVVGMAPTPTGGGYWLTASDGGVFAYGDAAFYGSMAGRALNAPIVGIVGTPTGRGYWLVGADGGVFAYGDAGFYGSKGGQALNAPISSVVATPTGHGYWLIGRDGGVFAYGDAPFLGSSGSNPPATAVSGASRTGSGLGYQFVTRGGDVRPFAVGDRLLLTPGQRVASPSGRFALTMQGDGNLVLLARGARPIWASGTNVPGSRAVFQGDGNLVVYSPSGVPLWASNTAGSGAISLNVQDDGNLVLYAPADRAVWQTGTRGDALTPGVTLYPGQSLFTPSGRAQLIMQGDGNLVLYGPTGAIWATGTNRGGTVVVMQTDGNLVLRAPGNVPAWSSGTPGNPGTILVLQEDGNLVLYAPGNHPIWATGTRL